MGPVVFCLRRTPIDANVRASSGRTPRDAFRYSEFDSGNGTIGMTFIAGLGVWLVIGVVGGILARAVYRESTYTVPYLAIVFGVFGAVVGGMLATSAYVFHDPQPLRVGSLIGAAAGGFIFPFVYQLIGRRFV
jgi:uncharacterized membrane protein YeaQ/YmgE (transglycosylase-associated protein family)